MLELEHKQDELRSELIKLRDLYNIARKSYNAVREVYLYTYKTSWTIVLKALF